MSSGRFDRALVLAGIAALFAVSGVAAIGSDTSTALICMAVAVGLGIAAWSDWQGKRSRATALPPRPQVTAAQVAAERALLDVWRQARPDGLGPAPHDRYAVWAQAVGGHVELQLLRCVATAKPVDETTPFPLTRQVVSVVDPDDIEDAAGTMELLRQEAAEREGQARAAQAQVASAAQQEEYDAALQRIDVAAAKYQRDAERRMREEVAREEAQERRSAAESVAEALRSRER